MLDWHLFTLLGLGFLLGLRHALDADHVAAVSSILARSSSLWRSGLIGAWWGCGHTAILLIAGALVIGFKIAIPPALAQWVECGVGVMLIGLGASLAWTLYREDWHWHRHEHDGEPHIHLHHHARSESHHHGHWLEAGMKPFVVGMVHGLAGSAALLLVVLSTVETLGQGLAYIAVFGLGSIAGMVGVGLLVSVPLVYASHWTPLARLSLRGVVSVATMVVGVWTIVETGLLGRLF